MISKKGLRRKRNTFPKGWDEKRVRALITFYENQTEDEAAAEDEALVAEERKAKTGWKQG